MRHVERADPGDALGLELRVRVEQALPAAMLPDLGFRAPLKTLFLRVELDEVIERQPLARRSERQNGVERRQVDGILRRHGQLRRMRIQRVRRILVAHELEHARRPEIEAASVRPGQVSRHGIQRHAAAYQVKFYVPLRIEQNITGDADVPADQAVPLCVKREFQTEFLPGERKRPEHIENRVLQAHVQRLVFPAARVRPFPAESQVGGFRIVLHDQFRRLERRELQVRIRQVDHKRLVRIEGHDQFPAVVG